jgi:hypothetical protein
MRLRRYSQEALHDLLKFGIFCRINFSAMPKPAGKCVFCRERRKLTKSHIWPEWAEQILPQTATHHEHIISQFRTFAPKVQGPTFHKRVKPGHVGKRRPRNTCFECNGGWMREIEEATIPFMEAILLGQRYSLTQTDQRLLAALLSLVSMRVELSSHEMRAIPPSDHDWIRTRFEPPPYWKIWIARYVGNVAMDEQHMAMQISSSMDVPAGVDHCNTQVTTLVIGQLCAHLFSSTEWPEFGGYEGIFLSRIWPLTPFDIEVSSLPPIFESEVPWLHETVARTTPPIPNH